ncbi:59_t:CDS:2 [Ambispora leptoticha]|uniref:59_t:CDS:1 n=1 Tax=Ambispora leptoticha TaxID=144679 RepID=A0A9N9G4J7_9GLOM|nr:59_t:CDS:2 [Ambispora leptoticha]
MTYMTEKTELGKSEYSLNTKQGGEALELLTSLKENSVSLVFLDPQYEPVRNVLSVDYPLYSQINKTLLGNDRIPLWLLKTPSLKIVDFLVWHKKNTLGLEEAVLAPSKRKHPHQKPRELIKALIEATTNEKDLIIDPCADLITDYQNIKEVELEYETNERVINMEQLKEIPKKEFLRELKERVEKKKISEEEIFSTLKTPAKPETITEYKKVDYSKLTKED